MKSYLHIYFLFISCALLIDRHEPQKTRTVTLTQADGVGERPNSIVIEDFNHDDFLDLAVANVFSDDISIFLGDGNSFQLKQKILGGHQPIGITSGDFNKDGFLDLATIDLGNPSKPPVSNISIFMGIGDGTFQSATSILSLTSTSNIITDDINRDNSLDLVTVSTHNSSGNSLFGIVGVLLGNGDDTFQSPKSFVVGSFSGDVVSGDLNEDTFSDIITVNASSEDISVLLGNGDGTFQPETRYPLGIAPFHIAIGDLTQDGHLDIVTSNNISNDVSFLIGNGDGTFQPTQFLQAGIGPVDIAIGFVDNNEFSDIIVSDVVSDDVCLLFGNGDGTFQPPQFFEAPPSPVRLAIDDLNNDGSTDLITLSNTLNELTILFGAEQ